MCIEVIKIWNNSTLEEVQEIHGTEVGYVNSDSTEGLQFALKKQEQGDGGKIIKTLKKQ